MILPIDLLASMPITLEFALMLFDSDQHNVTVHDHGNYVVFKKGVMEVTFFDDGSIGMAENRNLLDNAFQVVRYIDNYLNSLKLN